MEQRIDYARTAPGAVQAMYALDSYVADQSDLEPELLELVKLRASQLNGCTFCIDMHTKDAREAEESEQRLYLLPVWREAPCYSERERAALAWTEVITQVGRSGVWDDLYHETREHFTGKELIDLTIAVIAINGWNRLAIAFRPEVGSYRGGTQIRAEPSVLAEDESCCLCGLPVP